LREHAHLSVQVRLQLLELRDGELGFRLQKHYEHRFEAKIHEHLEFSELALLVFEPDERSVYIDVLLALLSSLELWPNQEVANHLCHLRQVLLSNCRRHAGKIALISNRFDRVDRIAGVADTLEHACILVLRTLEELGNLGDGDGVGLALRGRGAHGRGADQVAVQVLDVEVGQAGADEVVFVEDGGVLNKVVELSEQSVLHELSLQEGALVNWTVEKALETHVPKEVVAVFLCEKVLAKVSREVTELLLEKIQSACLGVGFDLFDQRAVEESQVAVELLQQQVKDP